MSMKLRELIRSVRACKTAADERAVIAKECALIRTSFKAADNPFRHRNVAKLLYMHMLGYPTHFGQMECVKLIASPTFPEKRIGYLGLMILLDEKHQVLMLVTNSLKTDFSHKNPYIVGLALASLGNICSADMARDLANEVEKFFRHQNAYIRKKGALCAVRIIRKVPELIEEFSGSVTALLNDKNHAVLLTAVSLIIEMIKLDPSLVASTFRKLVPTVVRLLKNLVLAGYVSEYDVVGITDPFLQCKLIHLLRLLGTGDREASDFMNDILAQVAINTEPTKNPGNAILYETVMTIMSIEAEGGLRVLAVNILGRFLTNRDNNIRYVALATLCKCVHKDTAAVQRHRNTVVDCLKDADISIRRRALDLIYALVTKNNVKALVKELLNYLALTSGDVEFKADLTEKICLVVERFAPSKHWHIETIIQVLSTAGNYTRENVATDLILLIARTPNLQAYAVYKLFYALWKKYKNAQLPLMHVVVWCVGEYGDMLISEDGYQQAFKVEGANPADSAAAVDPATGQAPPPSSTTVISEGMVLDLLHKVIKSPLAHNVTRQYLLNALIKLTGRFAPNSPERPRLAEYIALYDDSMNMELQQRSCEYSTLVGPALAKIRNGVVGRMPVPTKKTKKEQAAEAAAASPKAGGNGTTAGKGGESSDESGSDESGSDSDESEDEATKKANTVIPKGATKPAQPAPAPVNLIDMDLFGGGAPAPAVQSPTPAAAAPAAAKPAAALDLMDLFGGGGGAPAAAQPAPAAASGSFDLFGMGAALPAASPPASAASNSLDMFGAPSPAAAPATSPGVQTFPTELVYDSGKGVQVHFSYSRRAAQPELLSVTAAFSNATATPLTNFDFQVAVLKHVVLSMQPATSTVIPPHSTQQVTQQLTLNNSMHGKKKLLIRVKIDYKVNGQPITETTQIGKFPD